jgi:hypothetical protein
MESLMWSSEFRPRAIAVNAAAIQVRQAQAHSPSVREWSAESTISLFGGLGLGATAPELNPSNTQEPKLVHIELNIAKRRGNADTIELQSAPLRCCNGAEFQSAWIKLKQTNGAEELSAEGNCAIAERRTVARRQSVQKCTEMYDSWSHTYV